MPKKGHSRHEIAQGPGELAFWANVGLQSGQVFKLEDKVPEGKDPRTIVVGIKDLGWRKGNVIAFKGEGIDHVQDTVKFTGQYNPKTGKGWVEYVD
jgi:hypothetical protein